MVMDIVEAFYGAVKASDWARVETLCTDKVCVHYHDAAKVLPWGGFWTGPEELRRFFRTVGAALTVLDIAPAMRVTVPDGVIVQLHGVWRVNATGARVEATVINRFVLTDGAIERYEVFPDSAAFAAALGTVSPAAPASSPMGARTTATDSRWGEKTRPAAAIAGPTGRVPEAWLGAVPSRLASQLRFLMEAERLRAVLRSSPVCGGLRKENSAEHSWHLALFAIVLAEWANEPVAIDRVVRMLLIHDIVEIDADDLPIFADGDGAGKAEREARAADRLFGLLPIDRCEEMLMLWEEFEGGDTPDARFARAMDCFQPILLNHRARGGTWTDFGVDIDRDRRLTAHIAEGSETLWQAVEAVYAEAVAGGWLRPSPAVRS